MRLSLLAPALVAAAAPLAAQNPDTTQATCADTAAILRVVPVECGWMTAVYLIVGDNA